MHRRHSRLGGVVALVIMGCTPAVVAQPIETPDVRVTMGETFTMPILLSSFRGTPSVADDLVAFAHSYAFDPEVLQVVDVVPGNGLVSFIDDTGPPVYCDIIIYPDRVISSLDLDTPYELTQYGGELFRVTFEVIAEEAAQSTVVLQDLEALGMSHLPTHVAQVEVEWPDLPLQRGDVDGNGACGVGDVLLLLDYFETMSAPITCWDAADIDDGGTVSIADAFALLGALFADGPPLPSGCSPDETPDSLPPCTATGC